MHILHLTPYYAPAYAFGGVVRAVEGLAQAQAQRGHRVTVLTTDAGDRDRRGDAPADEVRDGVRVLRVPNCLYALRRLNLSTPLALRRLAPGLLSGVEVLHAHELRTLENLLVIPAAARAGVPVALSPHGTLTWQTGRSLLKRTWDRWLSPLVMRPVTAVVGLHEGEAEEARAFWNARGLTPHIATIPNGIDVDRFAQAAAGDFRARWGLGDAVVVLFLGRLQARKGVLPLAQAFTQLAVPSARLVIAGPDEGMQAALLALAKADARIVLTGYLDGEARLQALAAADVFALPAEGEGLSMAMLEAMAAGLPLLLAPGCHFPQAQAAGAGLIVTPTPDALARALAQLIDDPARRRAMGEAARHLARASFAWDSIAAQWEQVYAQLTSLSPGSSVTPSGGRTVNM